jgi:hypothetical protein
LYYYLENEEVNEKLHGTERLGELTLGIGKEAKFLVLTSK